MNVSTSTPRTTSRSYSFILITLLALMVIYWVANLSLGAAAQVALPWLPIQEAQGETLPQPDFPSPLPVPTPPAAQGAASATPSPARAVQQAPALLPQPVPTPPAGP